jgi:hypothetical protein
LHIVDENAHDADGLRALSARATHHEYDAASEHDEHQRNQACQRPPRQRSEAHATPTTPADINHDIWTRKPDQNRDRNHDIIFKLEISHAHTRRTRCTPPSSGTTAAAPLFAADLGHGVQSPLFVFAWSASHSEHTGPKCFAAHTTEPLADVLHALSSHCSASTRVTRWSALQHVMVTARTEPDGTQLSG